MLVVRVELWDGFAASHAREVGRVVLANASRLAANSDYLVLRSDDGGVVSTGLVLDHARRAGIWPLVGRATGQLDPAPAWAADPLERMHALVGVVPGPPTPAQELAMAADALTLAESAIPEAGHPGHHQET